MTFNPLRVTSKGRFFVPLACIAALLVTHVTPVLAADSRAAPAMEAEAMKQPAMDHDTQYAGFEDLASHHRFQRHEEQLDMRALSENEKDDDKKESVDTKCLCKTTGTICGSTFDMTCGYVSDAIFNCEKVKEKPIPGERCASKFCKSVEKECGILGPCMCKGPGQICGSSFETSCDLNADSLYYCSGVGSTPSEIKSCKPGSESKSKELWRSKRHD
ncbi:hypothetical protein BGZ72_005862 [Mortierella alpina]|nr:hypothetical protein BGZ72_005862 [Mortierella alpina]